jgi:uroporphyrinogen-III synthase
MGRVLVLRPEPGAGATVERARELGLNAVAMPLFKVEPVDWAAPEPSSFDGLLLTSANAIRYAADHLAELRGLKVYAVGEATADAARDAGFDIAATGDSGVDRLLGSIEGDLKLLHLCGEDRREPEQARQRITRLVVYRSCEIEAPNVSRVSGSVALIHSPRAGRRFAALVRDRGCIAIAAISPAAAEAVGGGWSDVQVAAEPNDDALLALASRLCNNPRPK